MDGSIFDLLTKTFTEPRSRRGVSRLLGGLTMAGPLALLGVHEGTAKKKKPCPPCKKRKKGKCKANLPDGAVCSGGTCQGGSCVAVTLPPPSDLCTEVACGAVPNGTSRCADGNCVIDSCAAGFRDCRGGVADGCETNVTGNLQHCGACDRACPGQGEANTTTRCSSGKCEQVRTYATAGTSTFTVPADGTVSVEALGAGGGAGGGGGNSTTAPGGLGGSGGPGGRVTASFAVVAGEVLQINVGGQGGRGSNAASGMSGQGGPAGINADSAGQRGAEVTGPDGGGGGGGGGASDVRRGAFALSDRILSAFGGGGGGGGAGAESAFEAMGGAGGRGGTGGGGTQGGPGGPSNTSNGSGVPGAPGSTGSGFGPTGAVVIPGAQMGNGWVTLTFVEA